MSSSKSNNDNAIYGKEQSIDKIPSSPFYPREIKAVKDIGALKEALFMFEKLQASATALQNPPAMSKFSPSPLLLLSMQRLLDNEEARRQKHAKKLNLKMEVISRTDDDRPRKTEFTPQLVVQQRNSRGGRARFVSVSNKYSAGTPCSNYTTATITPRINSRRRRKTAAWTSQQLSLCRKSTEYAKSNQITPKEEEKEDGLVDEDASGKRRSDNELSCSPRSGIALDENSSYCQESSKDNHDDFAFHSQSSLPMTQD
jgi:hypothetical protein